MSASAADNVKNTGRAANEETDSASKCPLAVSTPLPRALLTAPRTLALLLQLLVLMRHFPLPTHKEHVNFTVKR